MRQSARARRPQLACVHIDTRARMGRYDDGEEEDLDLEEVRLCFTSFLEFKMI